MEIELKKIIKGDVQVDESTLDTYSRDASLFEIRPSSFISVKNSFSPVYKRVDHLNNLVINPIAIDPNGKRVWPKEARRCAV